MTLDTELLFLLNSLAGQSALLDGVIVFFAKYLAYITVAALLVLLYFSSYAHREKLRIFFVAIAAGLVARYGAVELVRYFYERPRPFVDLEVTQLLSHTAGSFPSGHAAFFFAMATALYLYNKKWRIGFFAAAVLITVSRVVAGIHYPSDILGGAIIGILIGLATFSLSKFLSKTSSPDILTK